MFKIFCDETWTSESEYFKVEIPYIVFYGVMIEQSTEEIILQRIDSFKRRRGLFSVEKDSPVEIKWHKVEDEWKGAAKTNQRNRYEEFLDLFCDEIKAKKLSFGYMFLDKREYDRVEDQFLKVQCDNKQNFFFMLYFQFLYHCFIKNQVRQQPCEIWIDQHNMGADGQRYEIDKLKEILNKKIYKEYTPKGQMVLSQEMKKQLVDSIKLASLAESKDEPLVQLADLCAGCVRYILENQIVPPELSTQISLFESKQSKEISNGRDSLTDYFYRKLRTIKGYDDINLLKISYHHRFNIFPFEFRT